jgi:hypothetical protein
VAETAFYSILSVVYVKLKKKDGVS